MSERGRYVVLEGLDGSGKSTQHKLLLELLGLQAIGVREPGGTEIAEAIRNIVKDGAIDRSPRTNAYLFSAARTDLLDKIIGPKLEAGKHVVSDRNWLSTIAGQSVEGVSTHEIWQLSRLAMRDMFYPDLLVFIDTNVNECFERQRQRGGGTGDYFETKGSDYFMAVRQAYLRYVEDFPHHIIVNGNNSIEAVAADVQAAVNTLGIL